MSMMPLMIPLLLSLVFVLIALCDGSDYEIEQ
jgi:hypothetical protein